MAAAERAGARTGSRGLWHATAVAVAAALLVGVAVRLALALWMPGPFTHADEAGYFALARHLVGEGPDPQLYFYPGYALLLAPPFLLGDDPEQAYRIALLINCALGAVTILLAARIGRLVSPHRLAPAAAALAAALYPAAVVNTSMTWSENLLVPLVLALALALAGAVAAPAVTWRWALPGLCAGALHLTHPRALPAAVAVVLVALVALRPVRRHLPALGVAIGSTGLAVALAQLLATSLTTPNSAYSSEAISVSRALSEPGPALAALAGVLLYGLAATFGVAGLGAARALRRLPAAARGAVAPRDAALLGLLLVAAGLVAVTVLAMAVPAPTRGDYLVYGRYAEPGFVGLLVVGAAALVDAGRRQAALVLGSLVAMAPCAAAIVALRSAEIRALPVNPANVWGILPAALSWESWVSSGVTGGGVRPWVIAGYGAIGGGLILLALAAGRGRGWPAVLVLAAFGALGSWVGYHRILDPIATTRAEQRVVPPVLRRVQAVAPAVRCVAYDRERASPWHRWDVAYWTTLRVVPVDGLDRAAAPCGGLVLTAARDVDTRFPGAVPLVAEAGAPQTLWVLPGQLADRLRDDVTVAAPGWAPLPDAARVARIALVEAPASLAPGASGSFRVEVENAGRDVTWSVKALHPVRLLAAWVPRGRFGPVLAAEPVAIDADVRPGDTRAVAFELPAADRDGGGLAPGAYDVLVRVEESELGFFPSATAAPLRVPVEVGG